MVYMVLESRDTVPVDLVNLKVYMMGVQMVYYMVVL
jgi:hypothetical protein